MAQETATPVQISAPLGGEALQGVVAIKGTSAQAGFRSAEISFAYQNNPANTWFTIQPGNLPVQDGLLASWDTTTIADGIYQLRLQVFLENGQVLTHVINGLRVRNYSLVETSTPGAPPGSENNGGRQSQVVPPTITPTAPDFQPASHPLTTPLPVNPAQISQTDLGWSAAQGIIVVVSGLVILGIYWGVRTLTRR